MRKRCIIPFILLSVQFAWFGCNIKSKETNEVSKDSISLLTLDLNSLQKKDLFMKRFEIQNSWGDMDELDDNYYNITEEDVIIGGELKYRALLNNGFKPISDYLFKEKILQIFKIDLTNDTSNKCKYIVNYNDFVVRLIPMSNSETDFALLGSALSSQRRHFFFLKTEHFLTIDVPLLIPFVEKMTDGHFTLKAFDFEIHRNKYLFNDDKSSLSWLLHNDKEFLEQLVRIFGYDIEPKINKTVLELANKQYRETQPKDNKVLENLFIGKTCEGKLDIRHGLFASIIENTTTENVEYFDMLVNYISLMLGDESELQFSSSEKAEIVAYFGSLELELRNRYFKPSAQEFWNLWSYTHFYINPEVLEEWEKHNYYNIPNFSEVLEWLEEEKNDPALNRGLSESL